MVWFRKKDQYDEDDDFETSQPSGASKRGSQDPPSVQALFALAAEAGQVWRTSFGPKLAWKDTSAGDSDLEDEDQRYDRVMGIQPRVTALTDEEVKQFASQVEFDLGYPDPGERWSWSMSLLWWSGYLPLRRFILLERILFSRERPANPAMANFVSSVKFEAICGLLVALNCVNIYFDTAYKNAEDRSSLIDVMEHVFTGIFVLEWIMRIHSSRRIGSRFSFVWVFEEPANMFDTFIVWIIGVLVSWILIPAGVNATIIQRMNAMRVLRIARIIRAIRVIPEFRELWVLVDGIISCVNLVFWALVIICTVIFVFSVFAIETIAKSETFKDNDLVQEHFGGLADAMFTLFQIMTFDSWSVVVREIVGLMPVAVCFFMLFIGIAGIVLTNLMTAIVVMNCLVVAPKKDEEANRRKEQMAHIKMVRTLKQMFDDIDQDGSGMLSKEEFNDVVEDVNCARTMKLLDVDLEDLPDVFDILAEGDGEEIDTENFIQGFMHMQGKARSKEMLKSSKRMTHNGIRMRNIETQLRDKVVQPLDHLRDDLDFMHEDFTKMQLLIGKHLEQMNTIGLRRILHQSLPEVPFVMEPTLKQVQAKEKKKEALARRALYAGTAVTDGLRPLTPATPPKAKVDPKAVMKPIPATWIVRRREELRARRKELIKSELMEERLRRKNEKKQDVVYVPGIHTEFEKQWTECDIKPPDYTFPPPREQAVAPKACHAGASAGHEALAAARAAGKARVNLPNGLVPPGAELLDSERAKSPEGNSPTASATLREAAAAKESVKSPGPPKGSPGVASSAADLDTEERSHPHVPSRERLL